MIDYNYKSVSGQFIFSAVTPPSSQSQLSASVCPLSLMRPSHVWVQAQATAQCCQHCPISAQSESDTKYESCMKASRAHQPSASCLLLASFLMDCESCVRHSSCFFVLGSIDILIFAQMKVNVDHQTPGFDRNGAWDKGAQQQSLSGSLFCHEN